MHLEHNPTTGATAAVWSVVDDFGTHHHEIFSKHGDFTPNAASQRWNFYRSAQFDPDWVRVTETRGDPFFVRLPMLLAGPFGTCIETTVEITFHRVPAWDELHSRPLLARLDGARIEIDSALVYSSLNRYTIPESQHRELEKLCWDHVARADAEDAQRFGSYA